MTTMRGISLGDGYNALEGIGGTPKGSGAIKEIAPKDLKRDFHFAASSASHFFQDVHNSLGVNINNTNFDMVLIKNYQDLLKALGLKCIASAALFGSSTASLEATFYNNIKLTNQTLSLFIKSTTVTHVNKISSNAKMIPSARKMLRESLSNFAETFGDEFVSETEHGKKLYAVITYINIEEEELNEIKSELSAIVASLGLPDAKSLKTKSTAEVKLSLLKKINKHNKNTIVDIKLAVAGVNIDIPNMGNDITKLLDFIESYNKSTNIKPDTVIGFSTKPYVTVCTPFHTGGFDGLKIKIEASPFETPKKEKREDLDEKLNETQNAARRMAFYINAARLLLDIYGEHYQQLRFYIPIIKKFLDSLGRVHFKKGSDQKRVIQIMQLLQDSEDLFESIKLIIEKIYQHRLNIRSLITLTKKELVKELKIESKDSGVIYNCTQEETIVYDYFRALAYQFKHAIAVIQKNIDLFSSNISVELTRISPLRNYFHLGRIPSMGANVVWKIHLLEGYSKIDISSIKFNILVKQINNSNCITTLFSAWTRSWHTEHYDVVHGVETKLNVNPHDRVKIQFHDTPRNSHFVIIAQMTGIQTLDLVNSRYAATWLEEGLSAIKLKTILRELRPSSFYFSHPGSFNIRRKDSYSASMTTLRLDSPFEHKYDYDHSPTLIREDHNDGEEKTKIQSIEEVKNNEIQMVSIELNKDDEEKKKDKNRNAFDHDKEKDKNREEKDRMREREESPFFFKPTPARKLSDERQLDLSKDASASRQISTRNVFNMTPSEVFSHDRRPSNPKKSSRLLENPPELNRAISLQPIKMVEHPLSMLNTPLPEKGGERQNRTPI